MICPCHLSALISHHSHPSQSLLTTRKFLKDARHCLTSGPFTGPYFAPMLFPQIPTWLPHSLSSLLLQGHLRKEAMTTLSKTAPHAVYSPLFCSHLSSLSDSLYTPSLFTIYLPFYSGSFQRVGTSFLLFITVFPVPRLVPLQNRCSINICVINQGLIMGII